MNTIHLDDLPNLASDKELQQFLRKSQPTLWRWRKMGLLPFHRCGSQIVYTKEDIQLFWERCRQNGERIE